MEGVNEFQPWDLAKQQTHVSDGTQETLVLDQQDAYSHEDEMGSQEGGSVWMEDCLLASAVPGKPSAKHDLSDLNISAIENRDVDDTKVKLLLTIKAQSQDQTQDLASDRRKGSSYIGIGGTIGDRESKDIAKLLRTLRQEKWKKSASTGNAEPLLRARRDVELCDSVQKDIALCAPSARAPALLWSSAPAKSARRLGSLDMISDILLNSDNHFHEIPVAQDLETIKRVTFLEAKAGGEIGHMETYAGPEGQPGSPTGLNHTISRKKVGEIHTEIQASPFISAPIHIPQDRETFRRARDMWPSASGIGSLGVTFGTSRSLFDLKEHGIQEAEMYPQDAFDVATLTRCTDFASPFHVASPSHPKGHTTDGLRTVAPEHFGIKTFSSHPDFSAESPVRIRSPDRAGRPLGFDMLIDETHPQQRSPRQHRRALNQERGPGTHDHTHKMARSIASFRDVLPSTILDITSNYQEFFSTTSDVTTAVARDSALPFVVTNSSLMAPSNSKLPSVYYMGNGMLKPDDDHAESKSAAGANQKVPKLPSLTSFAPPVFSVNGVAIPSSAVTVRRQMVARQNSTAKPSSQDGTPRGISPTSQGFTTPGTPFTPGTRPATGMILSRPATQDKQRPFTPGTPGWFQNPTTPSNPAQTELVFINKIGDVEQKEIDSFFSHFNEFTLKRQSEERRASPFTPVLSTPSSELSIPSRSSATRHLVSSDTVRDIRTADFKDWTVPRTPLTKVDPKRAHLQFFQKAPEIRSAPRTPRMENAEEGSHLRHQKADSLRDLFEGQQGFKATKQRIAIVDVVVNEGGYGYWDAQALWCAGGMLIFESAPYDQVVTVWHPAKRGVPGKYEEEVVNNTKLTRMCHFDEIVLLQERALKDKPFALDIVSAEMQATFTSKFVWKKGLTGLRAERGDVLRVYRVKDGKSVYAEFKGYPGTVPAASIEISEKVKKKSVTLAFKSLELLHACLDTLRQHAPKAGIQLEPRTALLNAFGREGIANGKSRNLRSGVQQAFATAYRRMEELRALVEREHEMLEDQTDKSVLMGTPRRKIMAKELKSLPRDPLREAPIHTDTATSASTTSPMRSRNASLTSPPSWRKPSTPNSPLSRRSRTIAGTETNIPKAKIKRKEIVKFGVCAVCEKHGQCLVSVPKYCNRCAHKSVHESLNKGDLPQAMIEYHHVQQLTYHDEPVHEVTVGENSALQLRCQDAHARVQEARRLNTLRDLQRAAHCGSVQKIREISASKFEMSACVKDVEWVPSQGFLSTRAVLHGFSAVHYACMAFTGVEEEGKKEALIELVEACGLDPHAPASDGRLPMHIAVNEMPCLNYLIFHCEGSPEWRDGDGRTVLHHAAMYGGLDVMIFLIGVCDVDHTVQDNFDKTPLDYNADIAMLVRKRKAIKKVCSFFRNAMVLKCFILMKRHRKEPPYMLKFVPTEERKQKIELAARVIRRKLYQDWDGHGHPRLLKPWSSLLKGDSSMSTELSRLSSLDWTNPMEWIWYIPREATPDVISPCDTPIQEVWLGGTNDFDVDMTLFTREVEEDINMAMAERGSWLTLGAYVVHYDAKVVYGLESRPPTSQIDGMSRMRTPKDRAMRTIKPDVRLLADGTEDAPSRAGSLWGRVRSISSTSVSTFKRAVSFSRTRSGRSTETPIAEDTSKTDIEEGKNISDAIVSTAMAFSRAFSFSKTPSAQSETKQPLPSSDTCAQESESSGLGSKAIAASFLAAVTPRTVAKDAEEAEQRGSYTSLIPQPPAEQRVAASVLRAGALFQRAIRPPEETD